jgi:outer-membrane receptor for ferric coprogen and ferric-rhodotorulic acid
MTHLIDNALYAAYAYSRNFPARVLRNSESAAHRRLESLSDIPDAAGVLRSSRGLSHSSGTRVASILLGMSIALTAMAQTTPAEVPTPATDNQQETPVLDVVNVAAPKSEGYTVNESSAATKLNLSPRETPQSMTVMTRERLDDQDLTSMRQVLDNTPGIYSNAYDTERVLFYSRGFLVDTLI